MASCMSLMGAQEIVRKRVGRCGTGAVAYAPKKWIGKEIILILPKEGEKSAEEKIMEVLKPHLAKIEGIFLYGSYARNEQTKDSDIDVMVVATEPFKAKAEGMDFVVMNKEFLFEKIRDNPIEYYPMALEARPIFNGGLLDEIKKVKIEKEKLLWIEKSAGKPLRYSEELIGADRKKGSRYLTSPSVIYSLFLRARGAYIAKCIIGGKRYYSKQFRDNLAGKGISNDLYGRLHSAYAAERDDKKTSVKITLEEAEEFLELVKKELYGLKVRINGQEEDRKGN